MKRLTIAVALFGLAAHEAQAADITVTSAEIVGGKLVITGSTTTANMRVRLDGKAGAAFNATSDGSKAFRFSLAYLPSNCIVSLRKVNPASLGASNEAVVGNCGRGVSPRGAWSAAAEYSSDDIVTYQGSSWLARRDNSGSAPAADGDWQLFAKGNDDASTSTDAANAPSEAAARKAPPDGPAGGDLAGTYPDPTIAPLAVTGAKIANDTITFQKIAPLTIGPGRLATDAVTNAKIADAAVGSAEIVDESITSADLGIDSVQATEIADNSIDTGEIVDNSLFAQDLASSSVGTSELQDSAVTGAKVANESITAADIAGANANGSVSLSGIANGRCNQVTFNVGGAQVGDVAIVATGAAIQNGIVLYGQRVASAGHVEVDACNFSGTSMTAISNFPVRVMTFR